MGYYEQIGEANREYQRRRAAMHPTRRKLGDAFVAIFIWFASALLWLLALAPLLLLIINRSGD